MNKPDCNEQWKYKEIYNNRDKWSRYGTNNHGSGIMDHEMWSGVTRVLDVGCGRQAFKMGMELRHPDLAVTGVDFACGDANIEANAWDIPVDDKSYEYVTAFDVLEHLTEDQVPQTLLEFSRIAPKFAFSICYRESKNKVQGETLHPTVKPREWWVGQVARCGTKKGTVPSVTYYKQYIIGAWNE